MTGLRGPCPLPVHLYCSEHAISSSIWVLLSSSTMEERVKKVVPRVQIWSPLFCSASTLLCLFSLVVFIFFSFVVDVCVRYLVLYLLFWIMFVMMLVVSFPSGFSFPCLCSSILPHSYPLFSVLFLFSYVSPFTTIFSLLECPSL